MAARAAAASCRSLQSNHAWKPGDGLSPTPESRNPRLKTMRTPNTFRFPMTPKPALPYLPLPGANELPRFAQHPASVLAALGVVSGLLSTWLQGPVLGDASSAPRLVVYMPLVGLWFGLVAGYGVWRWGERSPRAALLGLAGAYIGWQLAANLAIQLDQVWLKAADLTRRCATGSKRRSPERPEPC